MIEILIYDDILPQTDALRHVPSEKLPFLQKQYETLFVRKQSANSVTKEKLISYDR